MRLTPYQHGRKAYKNGLSRSYGSDFDFCYNYDITGIINQEYMMTVNQWRNGYDDARYAYNQAKEENKF